MHSGTGYTLSSDCPAYAVKSPLNPVLKLREHVQSILGLQTVYLDVIEFIISL